MKESNTAERLSSILKERGMKASQLVNLCQPYCKKYGEKIGRNHISQYLHGLVEPSQKKLSILAMALNVSEVWLMGFNTSKSNDAVVNLCDTLKKNKEVKIRDDIKLVFEDDVELTNEDIDFIKTFIDTKMKQNLKGGDKDDLS